MAWRRFSPWSQEVYWALDLETSGLSPRRDLIVSVGMVPVIGGAIRWGERLYTLVRAGGIGRTSEGAMGVHQILPAEGAGAPGLAEVVEEIARRLQGSVLLVHHAPLDVRFLKAAFRATGRPWPRTPVVDTVHLLGALGRRMERLEPYPRPLPLGLAAARRRLGLPPHREHHALLDALATAELFLVLRSRLDARRLGHLL